MPCCAFAAFIISQIVLGFGAIKRFVLRSEDSLDDAPNNPATEWRLTGASTVMAPSRRLFGIRTLAFAASIEILLAVGAAYGYHLHAHHSQHQAERQPGIGKLTICARAR
jgi:hypothetical protein